MREQPPQLYVLLVGRFRCRCQVLKTGPSSPYLQLVGISVDDKIETVEFSDRLSFAWYSLGANK